MKSKSRPTVVSVLVVSCCVMVVVLWWNRPAGPSKKVYGSSDSNADGIIPLTSNPVEDSSSNAEHAAPESVGSKANLRREAVSNFDPSADADPAGGGLVSNRIARLTSEYLAKNVRPIHFYGVVMDGDERAVEGANVAFSETYVGKASPKSTDASGRFELSGVSGRYLSVEVSKEGYYLTKSSRQFFDFSPEGANFQVDANNPVIFRLRQKGPGADLITSQYGVSSFMDVSPPSDGAPVWIDLFNRRIGRSGEMAVSKVTPSRGQKHEARPWLVRLTIPGGGFIQHHDEFPFEAPESGYISVLEFDNQATNANWKDSISGEYYIMFGNPRRFGRIKIQSRIYAGVRLEYAINPDGSKYLEPK